MLSDALQFAAAAMGADYSELLFMGEFVTREHVRHNKSGIAHRGRTRINHLRELPTRLNHFAAVGRLQRSWGSSQ
jgi:hypothetical protein